MSDPLDLARWRALADGSAKHMAICDCYQCKNRRDLITAIRSACAEIERLRGALDNAESRGAGDAKDMLREYWSRRGVCLNCGHSKALEAT